MLLQRFPVRSGNSNRAGSSQPRTAGSTSGLLTPGAAGGPRGRSRSASIQRPHSRGVSRPPTGGTTNSIQRARLPLGTILSTQLGSNRSASYTAVDRSGGSVVLRTPSEVSLEEPIMTGVRRRRADSDDGYGDLTQPLSPSSTKRLKLYADQVAEETGCPPEVLYKFIDAGSILHMLIDLKACMFKRDNDHGKAALVDMKELIDSKDFKAALQSRLTACLLSPNLTAYVTDTHTNIMEFIKSHQEVFKIPAALIEDVELLAQLSKIVSELLSSIRGNLKTKLVMSIAKRMSVMDTAKSLAHGIIEVDSSHWNRYAFLRRCLRIFLIGVSDYKVIPLEDLYSTSLIPSLHKDLRVKIAEVLDCDVDMPGANENDERRTDNADDNIQALDDRHSEGEAGATSDHGDNLGEGENIADNREEDQVSDDRDGNEEADQQEPEIDDGGSGFTPGKNGKCPKFTSGKFWNFVDCSLEAIRKAAKAEAGADFEGSGRKVYENAVRNMLVEYFQMDLAEFPGNMVVPKLLATTSPQWQTTIQNKLLWG